MIQIMRLVTQKHLLMSSKTKKNVLEKKKVLENKNKEQENKIKEIKDKNKELKKKAKKLTNNQITNNSGKIIIKN